MIAPRYFPFVFKQLWRNRMRSALTLSGVAIAMFLFIAVQTLQRGVREATEVTAADTLLVVYRENRFCPAASRIPEFYGPRIARVPGVGSVVPMKIVVNNCRASLDVVTYRGVPEERLVDMKAKWRVVSGSIAEWERRSDAALVGSRLAERKALKPGDSFNSSGITVTVAGIIDSEEPQDQNVAYVHLEFLQRAASAGGGVGVVTQFNVRVSDPSKLQEVAAAIDDEFAKEQEPTATRPEKAFVAQAGSDIVELVGFTRFLGYGCLAAVLALVGNAIVLGVQDRIKEHAILQTVGFRGGLISRLILMEGLGLGVLGGGVGAGIAAAVMFYGHFSLSTEGLSINFHSDPMMLGVGLGISAAVGVVAGVVPAWQAGRREIAQCFRAV
ncbi:MAG: ABC transporter permease [Phycisphaerales bacterium]